MAPQTPPLSPWTTCCAPPRIWDTTWRTPTCRCTPRELQRPTDQPNRHPRLVETHNVEHLDGVAHVQLVRGPPDYDPLGRLGHPAKEPRRRAARARGRGRVASVDPSPRVGVASAWADVGDASQSRSAELLGQPNRSPHVAKVLRNQPPRGFCMGERVARRRHPQFAPGESNPSRARHVVPFENLAP